MHSCNMISAVWKVFCVRYWYHDEFELMYYVMNMQYTV